MPTLLTTGTAYVTAGTTPDMTLDLYDNDSTALTIAMIDSLTLTIRDADGNIINSRDSVDINDTGIGSLEEVDVDGVTVVRLTIKPTVDDFAYQGITNTVESHYWKVVWGWADGDGVDRKGGDIYHIKVERLPA